MKEPSRSSQETASKVPAHAGARHFCDVVGPLVGERPSVLVAGCGNGEEAWYIAETLGGDMTMFDVGVELLPDVPLGKHIRHLQASVQDIPFPDGTFDAVFYHHVIEHVSDAERSLDEISRVTRPGGYLYVGTPNRHRLVGYVGGHGTTFKEKILWNIKDYKMRLKGKFRNEFGAHAGYSHRELDEMLKRRYASVDWLTAPYLNAKYRRLPGPVRSFVTWPPAMEVIAPSIYALAKK